MKKAYNITELCNVFNLPSSSYYYKPVDLNKKYATMIAKNLFRIFLKLMLQKLRLPYANLYS